MVSLNDVLLAMSNIPVDDPIAEIWGRGLQGGYEFIEYTGTLPITINADGNALLDYKIYGNTIQNGAPTPENPVDVIGCGERVDITGLSEPLCGVGTYIDSLDLTTGILTRRIKKLVLTGEEGYTWYKSSTRNYSWYIFPGAIRTIEYAPFYCSHGETIMSISDYAYGKVFCDNTVNLGIFDSSINSSDKLKAYLAAQYAAGAPVTVWYVLSKPEVSTIPIPSGLTGTIEGYLIQDGTPTPETPIYPTANGVKQADDTYSIEYGYKLPMVSRTENLFDKTAISTDNGYIPDGFLHADGTKTTNITYCVSEYIAIDARTTYMIYCAVPLNLPSVCFYDSDKNFISGVSYSVRDTIPFTTPQDAKFLRLSYRNIDRDIIMLNLGSEALPYEPYHRTVTDIYLGEAETTRRIKKLVLTGEETDWRLINGGYFFPVYKKSGLTLCTHYIPSNNTSTDKSIYVSSTNTIIIYDSDYTTLDDFKSYLAAQYAAGTPVTVWYVLAEPETGIVNEPLMKIGDYADTLSMEQADVNVPTFAGNTVIDCDGTPKPSQMYVKYKGQHKEE